MKTAICKLAASRQPVPFAALAQTSVDTQIKRVEQGLLPPVLIKGDHHHRAVTFLAVYQQFCPESLTTPSN